MENLCPLAHPLPHEEFFLPSLLGILPLKNWGGAKMFWHCDCEREGGLTILRHRIEEEGDGNVPLSV